MQDVSNTEKIVRILHRDWVVEGQVQINAFSLRLNETYISVNRPAISSFFDDVLDFITKHQDFLISENSSYQQASLGVGDVRNIKIELGKDVADVVVEVEPRDKNYLSHAGIFTRCDGKNLKGGQQDKHIPVAAILQKVQYKLLQLSHVEVCKKKK